MLFWFSVKIVLASPNDHKHTHNPLALKCNVILARTQFGNSVFFLMQTLVR